MKETDESQRVVMPFGKYKGEYLGDIPVSYLIWAYENLDLRLPLRKAIKSTIKMLERSKS